MKREREGDPEFNTMAKPVKQKDCWCLEKLPNLEERAKKSRHCRAVEDRGDATLANNARVLSG